MGIFKNLFNSNNKQATTDPYFDMIYNYFTNDDDLDVNDKNAINFSSDVYSVVTKIANNIADKSILSTNSYVANLLNKKINNYTSARDWKVATIINLLVYGDSFSLIETGDNGTISSITLLPTAQVVVVKGPNGLQYRYNNDQTYNDNEILHFKLNTVDSLTGVSPLLALKNTLKLSRSSIQLLNKFYRDSCFNSVILQVDDKLSNAEKMKLKKAFQANLGTNASGSIVSDNSIKIQPLNQTSNVSSNVIKETKADDYFAKKIAAAFHVDAAAVLNVVNPHSNNQDLISQYQQDLKPYENIITAELNNKLNGFYKIEDPVAITSADTVASLVKNGAISSTEAKQLLGIE